MSTPGITHPMQLQNEVPQLTDREKLEKAVEDAWRDYDIAYIALMAFYKENT